MVKKSIREIRRAEFTQAAFDELVASGIRGTTLDRVATRAGVSKSVLLHHFRDKDELFDAVMRRATGVLKDGVVELLRHAETPLERLYAVIVGNFAEPVFNQQVCHAWISLCADAPHNPQNQRIQTVLHARLDSNLRSALRPLVPAGEVDRITAHFRTTIDGLWVRASLLSVPVAMREALDHMSFVTLRYLGGGDVAEAQITRARAKMEQLANIILKSKAFSDKTLSAR